MTGNGWLRRVTGWRRVLFALIAAGLVAVIVTGLSNIHRTPHHDVTRKGSPAPVASQPFEPTNLATVSNNYGPFDPVMPDSSVPPDTKAPAILMVDDGSGQAYASEQFTMKFVPQVWSKLDVPMISNVSPAGHGYYSFQTTGSTLLVYTVKAYQPFFLESLPQLMLLFDEHGNLWQIASLGAQAKHLRQVFNQ